MSIDSKGRDETTGRFLTGNRGGGRPVGSRNKLGEAFISALCDDFLAHGADVIERVRQEQPAQYVRIIASILPKEFAVAGTSLTDLSDAELMDALAAVRVLLAAAGQSEKKPH
jgi:hypothetical protein